MSIKKILNQAFYLDRLIQANQCELERLCSFAESIPMPDLSNERVQGGERSDRVAKTAATIIDLERLIQADIEHYIRVKHEIRCVVDAVDKPKLKLILQERYLNFKKWEQIQDILEISDLRYLFRLHNLALEEAEQKYSLDHCFTI